ncbi:MAG: hypothetical protein ACSLFK_16640 [Gemmatimonadaceae bacterium]
MLALGNAGLGALGSIVGQSVRGKRMTVRGALQGAAGGGLVYAGKVVIARNSGFTNLLGRELAAVGSSGVLNASSGRGFFDHLSLPWGPVRVHIDRGPATKVNLKLDLAGSVATIAALADPDLDFELGKSLGYGVAVFRADRAENPNLAEGSHAAGVVRYRTGIPQGTASSAEIRGTIGHELVHVVQADFLFTVLSEPLEARLMGRHAVSRFVNRYVDIGSNVPLASGLNALVPYSRRPWESEAVSLAGRRETR